MAIVHFNEYKVVKLFDAGETIQMGGFRYVKNGELGYIRPMVYINDIANLNGTEKITIGLYADEHLVKKYIDSETINISDIYNDDPLYNTSWGWLGFLRIRFNRYAINKNITYYLGATISGYTPGVDMYISMAYDFPDTIYNNGGIVFSDFSIAMQIFMYEEVS